MIDKGIIEHCYTFIVKDKKNDNKHDVTDETWGWFKYFDINNREEKLKRILNV